MRAVLLVLVACGRVGFEVHGDGRDTGDGRGTGDGGGDALQSAACQHPWTTDVALAHQGSWFAVDEARTIAVFATATDVVSVSPPDTGVPTTIGSNLQQPRLWPSGTELYVYVPSLGVFDDLTSSAGVWTTTNVVSFAGIPSPILGTPSRTSPPRMVVDNGGQLDELELVGGSWQTVPGMVGFAYFGTDFGSYDDINEPSLSPDGLRLAFVLESNAVTAYFVFLAERASLSDRFATATQLIVPAGATPYVTQDCSTLYYTGDDGHVHRVTQ